MKGKEALALRLGLDRPSGNHCRKCKKQFTMLVNATKAERPGDVYSFAGMKETQMSGICEFCFDAMFEEK